MIVMLYGYMCVTKSVKSSVFYDYYFYEICLFLNNFKDCNILNEQQQRSLMAFFKRNLNNAYEMEFLLDIK